MSSLQDTPIRPPGQEPHSAASSHVSRPLSRTGRSWRKPVRLRPHGTRRDRTRPGQLRRYGWMWRMKHLLHVLVTAAALAVATWLVPGIELLTASSGKRILTLIVVALIVGIVNAVIKPIVKTI